MTHASRPVPDASLSTASTPCVGLIGWPVEHSVSPSMHNAAFRRLGLDWSYVLLPTPPEELEAMLASLDRQGYRGANVTVPHKQAVLTSLDHVDDDVRAIGAVNTIVVQGGRLTGHNTDAGGFLAALHEVGLEPSGRNALVLGAGGAARAVTYALGKTGCSVTIHNRTRRRADQLVREMQGTGLKVSVAEDLSLVDPARFDLLVNATSVGMWPRHDTTPWPVGLPLPAHWIVFDLVYNPRETRLMAQARAVGATSVGGLGMLVHQGALALQRWTGKAPPVDTMYAAAQSALSEMVQGG